MHAFVPSPTPPGQVRVVAAAWVREGSVLAALRPAHKALGGFWELPGGKVEAGESDAVALRRELREELGVELDVGSCFGEEVTSHDGVTVHLVALLVHDGAKRQEPAALEHEALAWVPVGSHEAVRWAEGDRRLLQALAHHLEAPC